MVDFKPRVASVDYDLRRTATQRTLLSILLWLKQNLGQSNTSCIQQIHLVQFRNLALLGVKNK